MPDPAPFDAVYVVYPRGLRTGGPEAMHQLVDSLRHQGQEAFLVPRAGTQQHPRVAGYDGYDAPEAAAVRDVERSAVVVPESYPEVLGRYRRAARFCWWLSVDNSAAFEAQRRRVHAPLAQQLAPAAALRRRAGDLKRAGTRLVRRDRALLRGVHHLAQSEYAWSFLYTRWNVLPSKLSDYTILPPVEPDGTADRGRTIAFNPLKSGALMAEMQRRWTDVEYVPMEGLDQQGVDAALRRSSVYLDLGHHPGKDRMPREAAVRGCVSVVARRGAGGFLDDVPIPFDHKVTPGDDLVGAAIDTVGRIFRDLPAHAARQEPYRRAIADEQRVFDDQVARVFLRGLLGSDE